MRCKKCDNELKTIDMIIECSACKGTGVYSGMAESKGVAVICNKCKGTGKYHHIFKYKEFTGRKITNGIKRVYLDGYGYKIGLGIIDFDKIGKIDMDKEGVSYSEFLDGKMPEHIKKMACPMSANQSACREINGFVDKCMVLNKGWIGYIKNCKYQKHKEECWKRFEV